MTRLHINKAVQKVESCERKSACAAGEQRSARPVNMWVCVCVVVFVGIIFSPGASCFGPARALPTAGSLVGVDGVSVVTHTTTLSVNDDHRHDYRFCCLLCDVFMSLRLETINLVLLSPTGHQTWVSFRGHYTVWFFLFFFPKHYETYILPGSGTTPDKPSRV